MAAKVSTIFEGLTVPLSLTTYNNNQDDTEKETINKSLI